MSLKVVNTVRKIVVGIFILQILFGCDNQDIMKCSIKKRIHLVGIPSASGIEKYRDHFFIIGDNSPWYFETDKDFNVLKKYSVSSLPITDSIIPKKKKRDLEAMTMLTVDNDTSILIFGSGSKAPYRNYGKKFDPKFGKSTDYDFTEFYELLMEEAKLTDEELNIEAAAILNDKLYLFNRKVNKIIVIKLTSFLKYIKGEKDKLNMKVFSVDLPEINGINAGFSGATQDEKNNRIIFTASVENTSNNIDDGKVLGSFIGTLDPEDLHQHIKPTCLLISENNIPQEIKVESLTINEYLENGVSLYLVSDSDGLESELFEVILED